MCGLTYPFEVYVDYIVSGIPYPPRSFYNLKINLFNKQLSIDSLPLNLFLSYNTRFRYFFNCLSPELIVDAINCIILEYPIIFVADNNNILSPVIESLLSLITPFKIQVVYMPLVPEGLVDVVQLNHAFVLGISKENYRKIRNCVYDEVYIAHLDLRNDNLYVKKNLWLESSMNRYKPKRRFIKFSEAPRKKLLSKITPLFNKVSQPNYTKTMEKIKQEFLIFFAKLLKGCPWGNHELKLASSEENNEFLNHFIKTNIFKHWIKSKASPKDILEAYDLFLFEQIIVEEDPSSPLRKVNTLFKS
jgi:hypothetical protein